MSKHTPGPWDAIPDSGEDSKGDWYVVETNEDTIAIGLSEPDARLIAAAPDLLHNLVGLTTVVEAMAASGEMFEPEQLERVLELARAAIAKAEGVS